MDRRTLVLTIASLCGTCSVASAQDELTLLNLPNSAHIGDNDSTTVDDSISDSKSDPASSGSLSDYGTDLGSGHLSDDSTEDEFDNEHPLPATLSSFSSMSARAAGPCAGASDACSPASRTMFGAGRGGSMGWLDVDTLLWWGRGLNHSPVIVGGANPTVLPSTPLLGGSDYPIGTDLLLGMRADVGFWLDDCANYGLGSRTWGIVRGDQDAVITNGGNSTGIQFFNASLGIPDTYLVNVSTGATGANTGTISVLNETDIISSELYGRALLIGDRCNRTDLIGGYTFLRFDNAYRLESVVLDGITNAPPPVGTVTTIVDQFSTKNTFHGGHIGLATNMVRGRVGFGLSGKVALGNMQSTSIVSGSFNQVPPLPNPPTSAARGLFAQSSNIGTITQDNFTFIPEMNAKLRYKLGRAQLGVGYTLIVLPEVAIASSQIDTNVDVLNILGSPTAPMPKFNTESYFLHGLDLGVTFQF